MKKFMLFQLFVFAFVLLPFGTAVFAQESISITPPAASAVPATSAAVSTGSAVSPTADAAASDAGAVRADTVYSVSPDFLPDNPDSSWKKDGESVITGRDGVVYVTRHYSKRNSIFDLFLEGGLNWMGLITLLLVALFLAAWKAPAWVEELGLLALAVGWLSFLVGLYGVSDVLRHEAGVSPAILWSGLRVGLIAPLYGMIVYVVSLVLRIVQKPRIR